MLLMLTSVFFMACEDDEDSTQSIIGKWYLYKSIDVEVEGGQTYTDEWTYDKSIDPNFFSALIIEITSDYVKAYENDLGNNYDTETDSYEINGNQIITTYVDGGETKKDTVTYHFEGDMFVVVAKYEGEGYSETYTSMFKPYSGEIPPSSWVTTLENDSYEPNNEYSSATTISVGEKQSHVTVSRDADWFKFDAEAGETYLIEVSGYIDSYMVLYDTNGMSIIDEDDDNDSDVEIETSYWGNPVILWNCNTSGSYYFEITGLGSDDIGYYSVELTTSNLTAKSSKQIKEKDMKQRSFLRR